MKHVEKLKTLEHQIQCRFTSLLFYVVRWIRETTIEHRLCSTGAKPKNINRVSAETLASVSEREPVCPAKDLLTRLLKHLICNLLKIILYMCDTRFAFNQALF